MWVAARYLVNEGRMDLLFSATNRALVMAYLAWRYPELDSDDLEPVDPDDPEGHADWEYELDDGSELLAVQYVIVSS